MIWTNSETATADPLNSSFAVGQSLEGFRTPAEIGIERQVRQPESRSEPKADDRRWTFEVVRKDDRKPVFSAVCAVRPQGADMFDVVRTDRQGLAVIQDLGSEAEVAVSADGLVACVVRPGRAGHYVVELEKGVALNGVVRDYWGERAPEGLLVIARERSAESVVSSSLFEGRTVDGREVLLARTGQRGEFIFTRCRPGATYFIGAVGPGISSDWARVSTSDSFNESVDVVGGKIVTAAIHLVDSQTGLRPSVNPRLVGRGIGIVERFQSIPASAPCHALDDRLILAGVENASLHTSSNEHDEWELFAFTGFSETEFCRAEVGVTLPGYLPERVTIEYRPVGIEGHAVTIPLDPQGGGWGALSISMPDWIADLETPLNLQVFLQPSMSSTANSSWYEIDLSVSQLECVIEGIPTGDFQVSVVGRDGILDLTGTRPLEVQVRSGLTTEVNLNVGNSSRSVFSLPFLLSSQSIDFYTGPFEGVLNFHGADQTFETDFYFPGPPYTFVALPPGEYSLMTDPPVMFPPPADPREAGAKFMVGPETAGVVHDLEVVF